MYTWCPCEWLWAGLALPSHGWGLGKMLHFRTRLVSPTLLLWGAKCHAGMSQESGCSPSAASHAGVTSSWEVTRNGFSLPGNREWLSGVQVLSAVCRGAVSALSSAMALSWRPEEVLPVVHHFWLFISEVGGFIYLVLQTRCRAGIWAWAAAQKSIHISIHRDWKTSALAFLLPCWQVIISRAVFKSVLQKSFILCGKNRYWIRNMSLLPDYSGVKALVMWLL